MAVGVKLTGASGEYISTPDSTDFNFGASTNAVCCIVRASVANIAASNTFVSTYVNSGDSFIFRTDAAAIRFYTEMSVGAAYNAIGPATSTFMTNDVAHWLAVTIDYNVGGSNDHADVKFWDGGTGDTPSWSQLGSTLSSSSGQYGHDDVSDAPLTIGAYGSSGASQPMDGVVYYAAVYDGIGANTAPGQGSLVAEWSAPHTGTRYRDSTGKLWTLNGSAYSTVITA